MSFERPVRRVRHISAEPTLFFLPILRSKISPEIEARIDAVHQLHGSPAP